MGERQQNWQLFGVTGAIIKKGEKRGEGEEEEKGRKKKREKRLYSLVEGFCTVNRKLKRDIP
jgi:hypothetical protein